MIDNANLNKYLKKAQEDIEKTNEINEELKKTNNLHAVENKNLNDKIEGCIKNETIYKNKISETDKQIEKYKEIEKQMMQLEEQNKQIEKAKDYFELKVILERYEKVNQEEKINQELLNEIEMKKNETMNLKSQYEADINNYKKQLEDKIEAERISPITANQRNDYFQKLLDKKEKENQKNLQDMEYENQMILEEIELLNEGKNKYNDKDSSDECNRKLKHKRKQMKILNDDEEDENNMYIEKKNIL
jgi:hypothetical protein